MKYVKFSPSNHSELKRFMNLTTPARIRKEENAIREQSPLSFYETAQLRFVWEDYGDFGVRFYGPPQILRKLAKICLNYV